MLGYHRVSDDNDELAVSPALFSAQMEALADADVTVIGLEQAAELLNDGAHGRYVCLTFDDGYRDNLDQAVPILERLQLPAQIYLATMVIDGGARFGWYREQPPLLTWDEVRDLARTELISFGAQSRTHPILTHLRVCGLPMHTIRLGPRRQLHLLSATPVRSHSLTPPQTVRNPVDRPPSGAGRGRPDGRGVG